MAITGIVLGILLSIIGIAGSILPGLPGAQLGYIGMLIFHFMVDQPFSTLFLVIWGLINIGLLVVDYLLPILGTKKFGGTKRGNTGCIIGTIVGIFLGPIGILIGPFLGAFLGEYLHQQSIKKSFKAAVGAFLGFVSGVLLKVIISVIMLGYIITETIKYFY